MPLRGALSEAVQSLDRGLNTPFDSHGLLEALADADTWIDRLAIFAEKADGRMQEHGDSPEGIRREERG